MISKYIVQALAAVLAFNPAFVKAQENKPTELRFAASAPLKTPWAMQIERYARAVEEESKGTLRIDAGLSSSLGSEQDTVQQLARGRIDMGGFGLTQVALVVPELALLAMPFFFKSPTELDCVLDTEVTKPVTELFAAKGVHFVGWGETGTLDFVGKRPFVSPTELRGVKSGTGGTKFDAIFWSGLGSNPTAITTTEVTSHFQTDSIDVALDAATLYVRSGLGKVAPVLTRLDVAPVPTVIIMNKAVYDKLGPEQKEALDRARRQLSVERTRQEIRDFEATIRAMHEMNGGQIVSVPPEQREEWRSAVAPLWPQMVNENGGESAKFFAAMEAARNACENRWP